MEEEEAAEEEEKGKFSEKKQNKKPHSHRLPCRCVPDFYFILFHLFIFFSEMLSHLLGVQSFPRHSAACRFT